MRKMTLTFVAAMAFLVAVSVANADDETTQRGPVAAYVDANGDGINDNAPDHDGDGIANHLDPDYQPAGLGYGQGAKGQFVDENGDGINDLAPDADGDGIPNGQDPDFVRSASGLGSGAGLGIGRGAGRAGRWGGGVGMMGAYVDADGDGLNDNAPDSDGDGIINCLDDDTVVPQATLRGGRGRANSGRRGR